MIILPDKNIPRAKFLFPLKKKEWITPSQAQSKDCFGKENQTKFRIRARLNDGHVVWCGWFDDREDFDAFLWAIASNTLAYEKPLWKLSTPMWMPDMGESLSYDFATVTFYTSPTGSNQTWTAPSDWNTGSNSIEGIGGGGSGGVRFGSVNIGCTGGGGGAYSKIINFSLTSAVYQISSGGAGVTISSSGGSVGTSATATWFNSTVDPGVGTDNTKMSAAGGGAGQEGVSAPSVAGGTGGSSADSWGSTKFSGGSGGAITIDTGGDNLMTGGGGAAGTTANGGNGVGISSGGTRSSSGGAGGAASGGTAGASGGGTGGNGSVWQANFGAGGGGGGRNNGTPGGSGGNYGGGGGASSGGGSTTTSGAGIQGIIVITYVPVSVMKFNMSMLGM